MRLFSGDGVKVTLGIDIIIPVYNALSDLKLCLQSIVSHTDLNLHRVILIDDKSPDGNVLPYLKSVESKGITVLANEKNLGFSGTVNRGIEYSERDIIILNSDTVVTANWVEKLAACAYSDISIATATPFSNNATLCSIPEFCAENNVPYGLSVDEYAAIVERASLKKYPRITVGVGFCMFVKRSAISAVGLFDAETFRRGYGEENDFCWRAEQLGYCHVLCDDTYIFHRGSGSFLSDEKKALMAEHDKILEERYPLQVQANREFVRDNPQNYLRKNAEIYAKLARGCKNILYVLHLDFRIGSVNCVGGTQFHVKDLTEHFKAENNVFVLVREGEILHLTAYFRDEKQKFTFHIGPQSRFYEYHSRETEAVLRLILTAFQIDIVHVHHVAGLGLDIFNLAAELEIPCIATLHDLFYLCPSVNLLEKGRTYCGGAGESCRECLSGQFGYAEKVDVLSRWRENCRRALGQCAEIVVPYAAAQELYLSFYPELAEKICVIPHGLEPYTEGITGFAEPSADGFEYTLESVFESDRRISGWAFAAECDSRDSDVIVALCDTAGTFRAYKTLHTCRGDVANAAGNDMYLYSGFSVQIPDMSLASGELKIQVIVKRGEKLWASPVTKVKGYRRREKKKRRIAFLGGLNFAKGSRAAIDILSRDTKYDWYIIGGIGDADLAAIERRNVFKTDWYCRENVGAILRENGIDLVCILSAWPETFCYTVSEAELAGVPVLATALGAQGARVLTDGAGWVLSEKAKTAEILEKIDGIFAGAEYSAVLEHLKVFSHRTLAEMLADYSSVYGAFSRSRRAEVFDTEAIYSAFVRGNGEMAGGDGDLVRYATRLESQLNAITRSMEFRMFSFFNRKKIPGKKLVRKFIFWGYKIYKRLK